MGYIIEPVRCHDAVYSHLTGPKRVIPRIAETVKVARQTFAETGAEASSDAAKKTAGASKAGMKAASSPKGDKSA